MAKSWRLGLGLSIVCGLIGAQPAPADAGVNKKTAPTVAVMVFKNTSTSREYDSLGRGLQSMMTTDLAQVKHLTLVERARLNEILAEHKLAKSGYADKKRAIKLGKLIGATHLMGGSFMILKNTMRVDARLVDTRTGKVVFGKTVTGEKDAFFELQKELVKRIVKALGVKPRPKERAKLARVHTADFKAFRKFSQGVKAFDNKRYKAALEALRAASRIDDDFKLAKLTLSAYERIISSLRGRAKTIRTATNVLKRLKEEKAKNARARMLSKLIEITLRKGKEHAIDRGVALWVLAHVYRVREVGAPGDLFERQRLKVSLRRQYYREAIAQFPKFPLNAVTNIGVRFEPSEPFDKNFAAARADVLSRVKIHEASQTLPLLRILQLHLNLPMKDAVMLYETLFRLATRHKPSRGRNLSRATVRWQHMARKGRWELAKMHRVLFNLDKSTAYFRQLSRASKDPGELERLAREIAMNRDIQKDLRRAPDKALIKEAYRKMFYRWCSIQTGRLIPLKPAWKEVLSRGKLNPQEVNRVNKLRKVCKSTWLGSHLVSAIGEKSTLLTGPMVRLIGTSALRYFPAPKRYRKKPTDTVVVIDEAPRHALTLSFQLDFTPAKDWWPPHYWEGLEPAGQFAPDDSRIGRERPQVGVFFGAKSIDVKKRYNRAERRRELHDPMRGHLLLLSAGKLQLMTLKELPDRNRRTRFELKSLATQRVSKLSARMPVKIALDSRQGKLSVRMGGKTYRFTYPKTKKGLSPGSYGLFFRGIGYAEIAKLTVRAFKPL